MSEWGSDPNLEFQYQYRRYYPEKIEQDLEFVDDAIETQESFEPFRSVGDVEGLLMAASNLAMFAEEFRRRTGGFRLPDEN